MTRLLPLLANMALLLALVSLAHAQEGATDTSSEPPVTPQPDGQDLYDGGVACLQTPLQMPGRD